MSDKKEYFECHCHSPEHTLQFRVWEDENEKEVYAYVFLNPEPWYKRVWNGVKYIFGYTCCYGYFDEFILNPKDTDRFIEMLEYSKKKGKDG